MRSLTVIAAFLAVVSFVCGCSSEPVSEVDNSDTDFLDEMMGALDGGHRQEQEDESVRTVSRTAEPAEPAEPQVATARGDRLELRLRTGDRFPLIKTVEQTLVQKSQTAPMTAHTRLELTLALEVEDVQPEFIQMRVRYSRVSYSHDLAGRRMEFDSAVHQSAVPSDAMPYAGMVNNGFSFRIGRDNRIRELLGYDDFLQRCVALIPPERRQTLLAEIGQRFGDDGVANFIDDTVGLLPYDTSVDAESATRVLVGDVWSRERRMMQPVPVHLTSTYRLTELNERTAEIEIAGRIAAGTAISGATSSRLVIQGGHAAGHCSVDRDSGLPLDLNVTQFVTMSVTTDSGETVQQEKQVVTRVRTFPEMRGTVVDQSPQATLQPPGFIQPAAATAPDQRAVYPIPTTTP